MVTEKQARFAREQIRKIHDNISTVFVGKSKKVDLLLAGFVSGLHVLVEDVPGVGKTTLARSLSKSIALDFSRIQFTPDLLPGDIVGMNVWDQEKRCMTIKQGSIMHQFILADEINRATPRTQSALLEAMQEESVSVDGTTYPLPKPFFVVATQNPSHFLGAYMLPEAELDRFGISFSLGYPDIAEGINILDRFKSEDPLAAMQSVSSPEDIIHLRKIVRMISIKDELKAFILEIIADSRTSRHIRLGLSTRSAQQLLRASQSSALLEGRPFVIPEDIISMAVPVLSHRLILSAETQIRNMNASSVIEEIVSKKKVPVGV
ncbi:MAG: MoxR family ATPase [Spirochaetaceae bacterium]|nr:MAG: MoxR family ATPase [Spirochaetaceae bacterium]